MSKYWKIPACYHIMTTTSDFVARSSDVVYSLCTWLLLCSRLPPCPWQRSVTPRKSWEAELLRLVFLEVNSLRWWRRNRQVRGVFVKLIDLLSRNICRSQGPHNSTTATFISPPRHHLKKRGKCLSQMLFVFTKTWSRSIIDRQYVMKTWCCGHDVMTLAINYVIVRFRVSSILVVKRVIWC